MTLPEIKPDPEPSEADIAELERAEVRAYRPGVERKLAEIRWKINKKNEDPDLFLVPFASEVPNYHLYLASPLWKKIRRHVLKEAGRRCVACGEKANQVHHRDYRPRVLAGNDISPLVALCKDCHDRVHYDERGKQRATWNESERVLSEMVAKAPVPFSL